LRSFSFPNAIQGASATEQTNAIELPSMRFEMEDQSRQPIDR
jgi:hypothetical protein